MNSFQQTEFTRVIEYLQHDPWHVDEFDRNCLHYAMMYREATLQQVLTCLMVGIQVNHMDCLGDTPMTLLLKSGHHRSNTEILEYLRLLLLAGADPNLCRSGDPSPLLLTAMTRNFHAMVELVLHGANINARLQTDYKTLLPNNTTLLSFAVAHGDTDLVEILTKSGLLTPETIFAALQKTKLGSDVRHMLLN